MPRTLDVSSSPGEDNPGAEHQADKTTQAGESSINDAIGTIDEILEEDASDVDVGEEDDETVTVSKAKLEKIKKGYGNYRKGLKGLKNKFQQLRKASPAKAEPKKGEEKTEKEKSEFVTKKEVSDNNEKKAIKMACKNKFIDKNWDKIVKYYSPRRGKEDVKKIVRDIRDAASLFKRNNPSKVKSDEDKDVTANLSLEAGKHKAGKGGGKVLNKKEGIIPQKTKIQEWYPDPDKKDDKDK